ncbi:hypothetical protein FKO01_38980 [Mesorhizobium sp. B2-3-3]|nr:hypothetical protein FKO01_38980 [Mesorhizobium sp. B2-3-3]
MNTNPEKNSDLTRTEVGQLSDVQTKAADAVAAAKDEIAEKARDVAAEGKEALMDQAQGAQNNLTNAIAAFGGAIRAAGEYLANSDQRAASKFAMDVAGGLERMSASLKDKPFEGVLTEVRTFGSRNPGVLIGGAVVAGLALGRFVKSTAPRAADTTATGTDAPRTQS